MMLEVAESIKLLISETLCKYARDVMLCILASLCLDVRNWQLHQDAKANSYITLRLNTP